jgi:hypothetical protein
MPTGADDTLLPFTLPSLCQKKITAAFGVSCSTYRKGKVVLIYMRHFRILNVGGLRLMLDSNIAPLNRVWFDN